MVCSALSCQIADWTGWRKTSNATASRSPPAGGAGTPLAHRWHEPWPHPRHARPEPGSRRGTGASRRRPGRPGLPTPPTSVAAGPVGTVRMGCGGAAGPTPRPRRCRTDARRVGATRWRVQEARSTPSSSLPVMPWRTAWAMPSLPATPRSRLPPAVRAASRAPSASGSRPLACTPRAPRPSGRASRGRSGREARPAPRGWWRSPSRPPAAACRMPGWRTSCLHSRTAKG